MRTCCVGVANLFVLVARLYLLRADTLVFVETELQRFLFGGAEGGE